eukprot:8731313-Pyramimonas_sp.AAC.1
MMVSQPRSFMISACVRVRPMAAAVAPTASRTAGCEATSADFPEMGSWSASQLRMMDAALVAIWCPTMLQAPSARICT